MRRVRHLQNRLVAPQIVTVSIPFSPGMTGERRHPRFASDSNVSDGLSIPFVDGFNPRSRTMPTILAEARHVEIDFTFPYCFPAMQPDETEEAVQSLHDLAV